MNTTPTARRRSPGKRSALDDLIYLTGRIVYDLAQHANKPVSKIMTEVMIRAAFFEMTGKRKKDPEPVQSVRVEKDTLDLIDKALKELQEGRDS